MMATVGFRLRRLKRGLARPGFFPDFLAFLTMEGKPDCITRPDHAAICVGFSLPVDYNANSEAEASRQTEYPKSLAELVFELRNLGAEHGIKAVRSLKAVLAPQSAAA